MPIDLGDVPVGTPPTNAQKLQIRNSIGLGGSEGASNIAAVLGIPTHADMTAANAALEIGKPFYNTALTKLDITTA